MVMIVAMPTGAKQSQKETQTQEQKEQQLQTEDSYKEQLQQQLKELLEHMDGVGKTRVMLTFSDEGTDQLDKNVTKDGNKKEETTVVYDTGDTRQPYVICRQMPKIEGKPNPACRCGDVLQGKCKPSDCKVFGKGCTPQHPIGACMVSGEGACSAYYQYS